MIGQRRRPRAAAEARPWEGGATPRPWYAAHPHLILAGLLVLLFVPFLGKPIHMDDPLFIWAGKWTASHPGDFYGQVVNWYGQPEPMHVINQNPPATAYLLAAAGTALGWSEPALHGMWLLLVIAAALGMFRLATRWAAQPLLATVVAVGSPAFLLSGSNLMCDMPLLAAWLWTLLAWEWACARGGAGRFLLAGLLAALALWTKYSAVFLLPVMLAIGIVRRRRVGGWLLALLIPVAAAATLEFLCLGRYGHTMVWSAGQYAINHRHAFPGGWGARLLSVLGFLGGGVLPAILLLPWLASRRLLVLGWLLPFLLGLGGLALCKRIGLTELRPQGAMDLGLVAQIAWFASAGFFLLVVTAVELWRRRDALALVLAVWLGCGLLFLSFLNWTVNGRSLLPMVPAFAILMVGRLERCQATPLRTRWLLPPLAVALATGFLVMVADARLADSAHRAADLITHKYAAGAPTWFEGHWGFQYYMEQAGAVALDVDRPAARPGEWLAIPANSPNLAWPRRDDVAVVRVMQMRVFPWLTTMSRGSGACFYAADCGQLPFVFGRAKPEPYVLLRVLRPLVPAR